ncbi:unnamed protein product [Mytilus edulis]|uniref:Uncharacterized protein n=1 Tax=Mytilus edulis TaxID=6550 RepID=A0A8S3SG36_MYTED|nr:unnamed protein product [Mytilus edulis]
MGRMKANDNGIKIIIWVVAMFVLLQFLNYDWNIFNFHLFGGSRLNNDIHRNIPYDSSEFRARQIDPPLNYEPNAHIAIIPFGTPPPVHIPDVDARIIVITFNRSHSLRRLLESLNKVDYLDDKVKKHAGIYGQWIWTWRPTKDTKEICVILEDDLSVSTFFYRYLKKVHAQYDHRPEVNGYALQAASLKHGGGKGPLQAPDENIVFLYPVLGSWGFSPSRDNWIGFQNWFREAHKNKTFLPLVPGILPTLWYKKELKAGTHENIWTMWQIYYAYSKNERTLYPNFPNKTGMTINWRENGLHFSKAVEVAGPLVESWDERIENLPDEPVHLDVNGTIREDTLDVTFKKAEKLMHHTLKYVYARMVLDCLPDIVKEHCYGCEVNHPSQIQHTCLMWTKMEHLETYFDIVYKQIAEKDMVRKMSNQVKLIDVPDDYKNDTKGLVHST